MTHTALVAHYYSPPQVKNIADVVGDSLYLAQWIQQNKPQKVIHATVRFMAETAKILNPQTQVIIPSFGASCSLVETTDVKKLTKWRQQYSDHVHVCYINSSAEHKAISDIVVTSRIVVPVIKQLLQQGHKVIFSPDVNMGKYVNFVLDANMPLWNAVCQVHDEFKYDDKDLIWRQWTDGPKYLIAHPESATPVLERADFIGSTSEMLDWIKQFPHNVGTIFVATESGLIDDMQQLRPELDIRIAPYYNICKMCSICSYMKMNTMEHVVEAVKGGGTEINYLSNQIIEQARIPLLRMMHFQQTGEIKL